MFRYIPLVAVFLSPALSSDPGRNATIQERPYVVSLQKKSTHNCGGSIISPTWILTAAHCFADELLNLDTYLNKKYFSIRAGSPFHDRGGETINVEKIIVHEYFNCPVRHYDVALVKLAKAIKTRVAKPIRLAAIGDPPVEGTKVTVSGWGRLFESVPTPSAYQLRTITFAIVDQEKCTEYYKDELTLTNTMFCAGAWPEERVSCNIGDSGGPLVADGVLTGILSRDNTCTLGIYTSIPNVRKWIKEKSGI